MTITAPSETAAESSPSLAPSPAARNAAAAPSNRRLAGNYLLLAGGETAAKLATFAAFGYLGHILGPARYGGLEFALAMMTFFTLPVDLGLGVYGAREIARHRSRAGRVLRDVATLRLLQACCSLAVLLTVTALLPQAWDVKLLLVFLGLSLLGAPAMLEWLFQGHDLMHLVALASIIRRGTFAALVFCVVRADTPIFLIGLLECAAVLGVALFSLYAARTQLRIHWPQRRWQRRALWARLRSSAPIGLSELAWALLWYFPTVQLGLLAAGEPLGWFGGSHRIVMALHTFVWLYFFNLLPSLSRHARHAPEKVKLLLSRSLGPTAWGGIGLALGVTLLRRPLMTLAYGAGFAEGAAVIATLIWLIPLTLISGHFRYNLIAHDLQHVEMKCTILAAALCIGLAFALAPVWGALGTAASLVVANVVNLLFAYRCSTKGTVAIPAAARIAPPIAAAALALAVYVLVKEHQAAAAIAGAVGIYLAALALCAPREWSIWQSPAAE